MTAPARARRGAPRQRPQSTTTRHSHRKPNRPAPARAKAQPAPSQLDLLLDEALRRPAPQPTTFAALGLAEPLVTALARRGITAPFAIQGRALPDGLAGRDVLGRAQTGAGKTLAFGLPMLSRLAGRRSQARHPRGLVMVPTRELAMQVADALRPLADALGLRVCAVFGGAPYGGQINALNRGVDVVVATPGRLIDLLDRDACSLSQIDITVLDEADHMADLGFLPAMIRLLDAVPADGQRMLFSATLDRGVERLVKAYLNDPAVHAVAPAAAPVESMDHRVFLLDNADKVTVAAEIAARPARTLFFVRTKHGADRLAKQLSAHGSPAAAIHGNLTQNARRRALDGFAAGHPRVLVATDVAARGIHVDDVDLVVHFDPPNDSKDYLHRSGRTARAGASGTVVSLVTPEQRRPVERLHEAAQVAPSSARVRPGHDAVREIAESGEPVPAAPPATPRAAQSRPQSRRPSHNGGQGRPYRGRKPSRSATSRGRRPGAQAG